MSGCMTSTCARNLRDKALFFSDTYNEGAIFLDATDNKSYDPVIKWSRDLRNEFRRGRRIVYNEANRFSHFIVLS